MPKMIVSIDGVVIKEFQLTKDRTTLGRRPYNDIVIDNLAVSGEHAALQMVGGEVYLEDLNSTNGSYVNGKSIKKQLLQNNDTVEVGKYKIRFVNETAGAALDKAAAMQPAATAAVMPPASAPAPVAEAPADLDLRPGAAIKVLSGAAAGREVQLVKVVTTIGKPGVAVAAITRRPIGFVVAHVEGASVPTLNGIPVSGTPVALKNGDLLELAGTRMQFMQP
ncbi:FHA domain-containing protein [Rhodoferax sediminis]|uniref:FHA domain-containing protein n=1 Tax=Rhodoferax sediminis TaxID=2509614 RepID=A0A515D6B0_9BURK|nr:FHA domain-containing protein [Rhodoferax sediminis]QDL35931.1 FHA domain-containing protein [Rhodoferax sediminis]